MAQILIVEDQPHQRLLYEQELSDDGYDVITASNARDALVLFEQHHPALVITDILLPGMNGIDLMERMLEIDRNLPIIVHSAYSSPSRDFVTWFARAYVMKSGDLSELKAQVRNVLCGTPVDVAPDRMAVPA
ncbi:MAG TPA: response regulator [Planctomycetota bacterium]|nr:response regulator [Planctomycetota bacterium]